MFFNRTKDFRSRLPVLRKQGGADLRRNLLVKQQFNARRRSTTLISSGLFDRFLTPLTFGPACQLCANALEDRLSPADRTPKGNGDLTTAIVV